MLENVVTLSNRSLVADFPDTCPICHTAAHPKLLLFVEHSTLFGEDGSGFSAIFACTKCKKLFYAHYDHFGDDYVYYPEEVGPPVPKTTEFSPSILNTSPSFAAIFNEAECAETYGLREVAGVGYRKALEFLVKDFACHVPPEKSDSIKEQPLAQCIESYIEHSKIRNIAKAATWIGNDEVHYLRKWPQKDIEDMKRLLNHLVLWVSLEIDAEDAATMVDSKTRTS